MRFKEGQLLRAVTTFTNERTGGHVFDPPAVVATFKDPKGQIVEPAPTRNSEGVWEDLVKLSPAGTWWGRIEGQDESGETIAVDEFPIEVEPRKVP